jgi:SAM-dependent methyltransferase
MIFGAINFDEVADIYDLYVNTNLDNDFFVKECSNTTGEILELMCGTGRLSIPLLEKGFKLVCVDYMGKMLDVFREKIRDKKYDADIIEMDVTELDLKKKFNLIILPFNSFSEILEIEKQVSALKKINEHLNPDGKFICTLHNPVKRLISADGKIHKLGRFKKDDNEFLEVSYTNNYNAETGLISGEQVYEFFDKENNLTEKRTLEINFRLFGKNEFEKMLSDTGFEIEKIFGNYDYSTFNENESPFMIWLLRK